MAEFPFIDVDEYRRKYPDQCAMHESEPITDMGEATFNTNRTPAQVVQEFTNKTQKQVGNARFDELEDINQQTGVPVFTCRATVVKFTGSGTGKTKKIAKQFACYELLKCAVEMNRYLEFGIWAKTKEEAFELLEKIKPVDEANTKSEADLPSAPTVTNWIGELTEFCVLNKLPSPEYEFSEAGPPNVRVFTTYASVGSAKASASGKKKKESKGDAAKALYEILQTQVESLRKATNQLEGKGAEMGAEDEEDEPIEGLLAVAGVNVSRAQTEPEPQKALETVLSDTTRFLSNFFVQYRELQQPSTRGRSQTLLTVQFSKAPPPPVVNADGTVIAAKVDKDAPASHNYVFCGEGMDANSARDEAARAALVHLLTYKGPREITPVSPIPQLDN